MSQENTSNPSVPQSQDSDEPTTDSGQTPNRTSRADVGGDFEQKTSKDQSSELTDTGSDTASPSGGRNQTNWDDDRPYSGDGSDDDYTHRLLNDVYKSRLFQSKVRSDSVPSRFNKSSRIGPWTNPELAESDEDYSESAQEKREDTEEKIRWGFESSVNLAITRNTSATIDEEGGAVEASIPVEKIAKKVAKKISPLSVTVSTNTKGEIEAEAKYGKGVGAYANVTVSKEETSVGAGAFAGDPDVAEVRTGARVSIKHRGDRFSEPRRTREFEINIFGHDLRTGEFKPDFMDYQTVQKEW